MPAIARIFFWGMLISFLGTLPLGTLNIAAMQIGISDGVQQALLFAIGCLLVEMLYVRLSLLGMHWVMKQQRLMKILDWLTFLIMALLAAGSFLAAARGNASEYGNIFLQTSLNKFFLGMVMSAINPVQIPFWFGWSALLMSRNLLQRKQGYYNSYIVGIGIGTLIGNSVFIFGGRWLISRVANIEQYINWVIGGLFALSALLQLLRILRKKDTFEQIEEKTHQQPTLIP